MSSLALLLGIAAVFAAGYTFLTRSKPALIYKVKEPKESSSNWKGTLITHQTIIDPLDKYNILCYDPATGYSLGHVRANTPDQVTEIVARSRKAQLQFKNTSFSKRIAVLKSLLAFITSNKESICRVSARDSGKTLVDANFGEIITACEKIIWTIENGEQALAPESRSSGRISFLQSARVEYLPIGVMGLIVSWNYPFHNVIAPMVSAIMAGNGCVIKVSEHVAWSTAYWQSIITGALKVNGVHPDLVLLVDGFADAGESLVKTADKIVFIGSPGVGKNVMKTASDTLTPVVLELGGKDAAIIFEDCDYKSTIDFCVRAAMQNSGQNCAGLERMIVHERIYERVVTDIGCIVGSMKQGPIDDVYDVGAMTMPSQITKVQALVDDAVSKGAKLVCGGKQFIHPKYPKGQFYMPTVLSNVQMNMKIAKEEIFGPVIAIYKFKTKEEAITITNCCGFGLGAAVFSLNYKMAEQVSKALKVGMCNVNGWGVNYLCQSLPFGGVGLSGFDRFAGIEGLRGNCDVRSATTDRFGHLGIRTNVPSLLNYPICQESNAFQNCLIDILYAPRWSEKVNSVLNIIRILMKPKNN